MNRVPLVVAGIWLYSTLLLLTAPATLVDAGLDHFSAGRVRLVAAQGSLWTGSGQVELRNTADGALFHTSVHWQPDPGAWLSARLGWRVTISGHVQPALVAARLRRIELSNFRLDLPAAAATAVLPAMVGYGLGGVLQLHVDSFAFGADAGGTATVKWQDASTALAPVVPLGSYDFLLAGSGGNLALSLRTLAGPLQLDGQGTANAGQGLKYGIVATLPAAELEQLTPFLQLVAVETADGSFLLQRQ